MQSTESQIFSRWFAIIARARCFAVLCLALGGLLSLISTPAFAQNHSILVIAPHPDDEALCCSGVIYNAMQRGDTVHVVVVTNGDAYAGVPIGYTREAESVAAMQALGISEQNVIFLGYGDQTVLELYQSTSPTTIFSSPAGQTQTYANRGLGGVSYHQYLFGTPGNYNQQTLLQDMEAVLQNLNPNEIYVTGLWDDHPDHQSTFMFTVEALLALRKQGVSLSPRVHETLIHPPCASCGVPSNINYTWPGGGPGIQPRFDATLAFSEPYYLTSMTPYEWNRIESLPVPVAMQNTNQNLNFKAQIITNYASQGGTDPNNYLFAFVKRNEVFWVHDFLTNLAGLATISVSSQNTDTGQLGTSAVDGMVEGDPDGYEPFEWATQGELDGAWIKLTWATPVTVSRVALYDRPNLIDNVISGTLHFSDGSTVSVSQLPNNGNSLLVSFPAKTISWVQFTADNAVGDNIGLAEIEVYGETAGTTVAHPQIFQGPTASAPLQNDQYGQPYLASIPDNQTTNLTVTAFDVSGQALTYNWSSDSGKITGTGNNVVFNPPVVSSPTLVTATVTVSDTQGASTQNNVFVSVTPSNSSGLTVSSLVLNPTSVASGSVATGTITLTGTAPNGAVVSLSSANPAVATVAPTAVVAPGGNTATFSISTVFVSSTVSVNISATLGGTTRTSPLTVLQPPVTLASITVNPATVGGGNSTTATVTLSGPAQSGGALVLLTSSQPSIATIPANITIPAGSVSGNVTVTTPAVSVASSVTLNATFVGGTVSTSVRVAPYVAANLATIAAVSVSSEASNYQQLGIKAIDGIVDGSPAPGDYTKEWATTGQLAGAWIRLTWGSPVTTSQVVLYDRPNLTDNVTSGTLSFSDGSTVPVGTLPNNGTGLTVSFAQKMVSWMQFTVNSATGLNIGLAEIAVFGSVAPASISSLVLNPTSVSGGNSSTGTITLSAIAPPGGAVVTLSSSNTSAATVPPTVTVPAGSTTASFTVSTSAVSAVTPVSIQGTYNGTQSATLSVNPLTLASVSLNPATTTGGASSTGTVTLGGVAPSGGALVTLSSSNPSLAAVPANVSILAGATTGAFTITTTSVSSQTTISISATYNGTQSATLTLNPLSVTSVGLNPTMVSGGTPSTGTVTLSGPAPNGGTFISLSSSNPPVASPPSGVTVNAGATSATFTVTTTAVTSTTSVTISAGTQTTTLLVTPSVSGGGGMQQFASDTFNRPNGSLGPNWSFISDADSFPVINGQQVQSNWGRAKALYYGGVNWPPDQYSQAQIIASNGGSSGPAVRMTSNGFHYAGTVGSLGTGSAQVYILLDNGGNGMSVIASSSSATVLANDYLQLSVQGTTLTLTNVTRSTTLLTVNDSTLSVGYPGIFVGNGGTLANWSAGLTTSPTNLTTLATDNFNRANAPNLGSNWAIGPGLFPIQIINDQIESDGQGQPPGQGHGKEYYTAVSFPGDQWSQAQVISSTGDVNGAIVRYQGTVDTHYVGFVSRTGAPGTCSVSIDRDINGAPVVLATDSNYCSVSAGDYLRLQVQGGLLSYIDASTGALLLTVYDNQITGGSPGWSLNPVGGTPTAANWSGGSFQ